MKMLSFHAVAALVAVTAALLVPSRQAYAQSAYVKLGDGFEIPLLDQTNITIDRSGKLSAQCVLHGSKCSGGDTTGSPDGPAVSMLRLNGGPTAPPGANIALAYVVQGNAGACLASSTPAVPGWNNAVVPGVGTFNFAVNTLGVYLLSLRCYGEAGVSNLATFRLTVAPPTKLADITDHSWLVATKAGSRPIALDRLVGGQWSSCADAAFVQFMPTFGRFWNLSYICASDASQSVSACRVAEMQYMPEPGYEYNNRLLAVDCNGPQPPMFYSGFE